MSAQGAERETMQKLTGHETEAELRDLESPNPKTADELFEYIAKLTERDHDYGTCVYAMSLAATAAFHFVAGKLGSSGFQASCADLDFLRRVRHIKGPFIILDGNKMLYPQYSLQRDLAEAMAGWQSWAHEEAARLLEAAPEAHPEVLAYWRALASGTA